MKVGIEGYKSHGLMHCNHCQLESPGPEVIKLFSCSTQLNMKFKLLINTEIAKPVEPVEIPGLNHKSQPFILLINVKCQLICTFVFAYMQKVDFPMTIRKLVLYYNIITKALINDFNFAT